MSLGKTATITFASGGALMAALFFARTPLLNFVRGLSRKTEPYSMAFVTAPDTEVAKKIAGGLGKH